MSLAAYLALWLVLALSIAALALYRKMIAVRRDDDLVHLAASEQVLIPHQVAVTRKLNMIDRWGKSLTVLAFLSGLLLGAAWLYEGWERSQILR